MNTLEAIAKRKSTRSYTSTPVPEEALNAVLQAGFAAPVAMARYDSLHITVIQSEEIIRRINDMTAEMFYKRMGVKKNTDFGARTLLLVSTNAEGLPPRNGLRQRGYRGGEHGAGRHRSGDLHRHPGRCSQNDRRGRGSHEGSGHPRGL